MQQSPKNSGKTNSQSSSTASHQNCYDNKERGIKVNVTLGELHQL